MRFIDKVLILLLVMNVGCSSKSPSKKAAAETEHPILKSLTRRDRNTVHVVLWTLEHNDIQVPRDIKYDLPYAEVQPEIEAVRVQIQSLPEERLNALDQSLAEHWHRYSPIWLSNDWP